MTIYDRPFNPAKALNLSGKTGLVVGIDNEHSLAWAAAQHFDASDVDLALTYFIDKVRTFVEPLAKHITAPIFLSSDVALEGSLEAVFATIGKNWAVSVSSCTRSLEHRQRICTAD